MSGVNPSGISAAGNTEKLTPSIGPESLRRKSENPLKSWPRMFLKRCELWSKKEGSCPLRQGRAVHRKLTIEFGALPRFGVSALVYIWICTPDLLERSDLRTRAIPSGRPSRRAPYKRQTLRSAPQYRPGAPTTHRPSRFLQARTPLTYAVSLLEGILKGDAWLSLLGDIVALTVVFAVCTALSAKVFRWE